MIARGRVRNGVVVLDEGVHLPEGREVTVVVQAEAVPEQEVSEERKQALLGLIGMWKMDNPPNDDDVDEIVYQERMKKYG